MGMVLGLLGCQRRSSMRRSFSAVSDGRPKAYSSFFVSRCQNRTTSLHATATVATLTPRWARIRSAKACSGPGPPATIHADSTRAQRGPEQPCLEMLPCRAGESPDWW